MVDSAKSESAPWATPIDRFSAVGDDSTESELALWVIAECQIRHCKTNRVVRFGAVGDSAESYSVL